MKKVIATAAGLMLVGAMASAAMAEVQFGGDARARFYTRDNYDMNDDVTDDNQKIDSRVRLSMDGTYQKAFAKAQVKIGDSSLDGTSSPPGDGGIWDGGTNTGGDVETDYAYMGVELCPITITAGRQPSNFGNKFWSWDQRYDRLKATWSAGDATLAAFYDKYDEFRTGSTGLDTDAEANDEDTNRYGAAWKHNWINKWGTDLAVVYKDDEMSGDRSGWASSFAFSGPAGPITLVGEATYQEADYQGTVDDGVGGFAAAVINNGGPLTIILPVAATQDGYVTDGNFEPTYLFGTDDNPIGIIKFGELGDTWAVAPSLDYKVSDLLTLHGGVAYADIDEALSIVEIDGGLIFTITDKTSANVKLAHGIPDMEDTSAASDSITGVMAEIGTQF